MLFLSIPGQKEVATDLLQARFWIASCWPTNRSQRFGCSPISTFARHIQPFWWDSRRRQISLFYCKNQPELARSRGKFPSENIKVVTGNDLALIAREFLSAFVLRCRHRGSLVCAPGRSLHCRDGRAPGDGASPYSRSPQAAMSRYEHLTGVLP